MSLERMEQIIQESNADVVVKPDNNTSSESKTAKVSPEVNGDVNTEDETPDNQDVADDSDYDNEDVEQDASDVDGDSDDDADTDTDDTEDTKSSDDADDKDDFEPFPKKASNVISRKNEKINELRGKIAEQQEALRKQEEFLAQKMQEQQGVQNNDFGLKEPVESDFTDYGDFLEAKGEYKAELRYRQNQEKFTQENEIKQQQQYITEKVTNINSKAEELSKAVPELNKLYENNVNLIASFSDDVKRAFLEADNTPLAFYALVQEDKLESIAGMSPMQAAVEIGKAQERGERMVAARRQTKAPAPATKLKTRAVKRQNAEDMSPSDLVAHLTKLKKR